MNISELMNLRTDIIYLIQTTEPPDDEEICIDTQDIICRWIATYIDNLIRDIKFNDHKAIFEKARKIYPGKKRGCDTEFSNFKKKHKDWRSVVSLLHGSIINQMTSRMEKLINKEWVAEWKNFQTWINNRCWEEEPEQPQANTPPKPLYGEIDITQARNKWMDIARDPDQYTMAEYQQCFDILDCCNIVPETPKINTEDLKS